jgi:hypothetical protein
MIVDPYLPWVSQIRRLHSAVTNVTNWRRIEGGRVLRPLHLEARLSLMKKREHLGPSLKRRAGRRVQERGGPTSLYLAHSGLSNVILARYKPGWERGNESFKKVITESRHSTELIYVLLSTFLFLLPLISSNLLDPNIWVWMESEW